MGIPALHPTVVPARAEAVFDQYLISRSETSGTGIGDKVRMIFRLRQYRITEAGAAELAPLSSEAEIVVPDVYALAATDADVAAFLALAVRLAAKLAVQKGLVDPEILEPEPEPWEGVPPAPTPGTVERVSPSGPSVGSYQYRFAVLDPRYGVTVRKLDVTENNTHVALITAPASEYPLTVPIPGQLEAGAALHLVETHVNAAGEGPETVTDTTVPA